MRPLWQTALGPADEYFLNVTLRILVIGVTKIVNSVSPDPANSCENGVPAMANGLP
jgi:hypothetical protein